jgi:5'-nucleotidase (lipoprotein e(P4) family)
MRGRLRLAALAVVAIAAGASAQTPAPTALRDTHENLHGLLWMQTSAEYRAIARGLYRLAALQLDRGLKDRHWTAVPEQIGRKDLRKLPPAVILDVDETVLDNTPEEGQRVLSRVAYAPDLFRTWAVRAEADTVPGAGDFLRYAARRRVEVFLITNRDPDWRDVTIENLRKDGVSIAADHVLCYGEHGQADDPGDKSGRRRFVAAGHRVLLMAGDDLGDFMAIAEGGKRLDRDARRALVERFSQYWEERWIVLPNPLYGSWERTFYPPGTSDAEALAKQFAAIRGFSEK